MKHLKMLGLAAVAAMAVMAFLGAGTASATVLCKEAKTTGCAAAGKSYPSGTGIIAHVEGTATLEAPSFFGEIIDTCTGSTVEGSTTSAGSATTTVTGNISNMVWNPCENTTDTVANGSLEIHWISGTDNGTLTGKNSQVTVNNPIAGTCTYGTGTGTDLGTLTGGASGKATMDINAILNKTAGGFACPGEARWTANYNPITINGANAALFVSES